MSKIHVIEVHAKNFCRKAIREGLDGFNVTYTERAGLLSSNFRIELPTKEAADALERWIYATTREAR